MRLRARPLGGLLLLTLLVACAAPGATPAKPTVDARVQLAPDFYLVPLTDGIWRHVSRKEVTDFGTVEANGLLVVAPEGLVLIDTPWTPAQTRHLLDWTAKTFDKPVRDVVITHSHDDRLGGSAELVAAGAVLHARPLTIELATARRGQPLPAEPVGADASLVLAGVRVDVLFPGAAHAPDNIVVWLPDARVLFGGCMVRALADDHLGNLADADIPSWQHAIDAVIGRSNDVAIVVPGHGDPGDRELLAHTTSLVAEALAASHE